MSQKDLARFAWLFPLPWPFDASNCASSCSVSSRFRLASSRSLRASISSDAADAVGSVDVAEAAATAGAAAAAAAAAAVLAEAGETAAAV